MSKDVDNIWSEIGVARVQRYIYGGIVFAMLAAVIDPVAVASLVGSLGPILAPLTVLGVGAAIYVIHRYVFGEVIIFPLVNLLHTLWDRVRGRRGLNASSSQAYLSAIGVGKRNTRMAYLAIRHEFLDSSTQKSLDITHSELHMLYITLEETIAGGIYMAYKGLNGATLFWIAGAIALCAVIADIRQHQAECYRVKLLDRDGKLRPFLKDFGYLDKP